MWSNVLLIALTAGIVATVAVITANLVMVQWGIDYAISDAPDVDSPAFLQLLAALLSLRLRGGNRIRLLLNGNEAFPAMFDAVRSAERYVMFENFVYWYGDIGRDFAELLSRKAQAGVHVHVVLDRVGSLKMDQRYLQQMRHAGVGIHRYHPPRFGSMHRLNPRTHRRELGVDGRVAFTGGIRFADEWAGDGESEGCRRDNHYEVRGSLVTDMQACISRQLAEDLR